MAARKSRNPVSAVTDYKAEKMKDEQVLPKVAPTIAISILWAIQKYTTARNDWKHSR